MRIAAYSFIILYLLVSCTQNRTELPVTMYIEEGWTLVRENPPDQEDKAATRPYHPDDADRAELDNKSYYPATVPGCVHLDLLAAGVIDDPFYRDNESRVQWVEKEDWTYETAILIGQDMIEKDRLELVFEGLDTHADIYLNGQKILTADNMFRRWEIDIREDVRPGENKLVVAFRSPVNFNARQAAKAAIQLPDDRAYSRKAPYQFGWDWGPRLVSCGIWKPVYLEAWSVARIKSVQVITRDITTTEAKCEARLEIEAIRDTRINTRLYIEEGSAVDLSATLVEGSNLITIPFTIPGPELWWTHDLGDPCLYSLKAVIAGNGIALDEAVARFGLRTIELVQDPDSTGESFYFRLNGHPVFMKGSNYIPQDNFPSRVSDSAYHQLISNCRKANMNMLRVWGGGIYESDLFYELCDEQGILVWQDFMFACTLYPADSAFAETVRQEAVDNITRLRNHPCIALWCGNNEVDEGWHNWGWQEQFGYSVKEAETLWHNYQLIFNEVLPGVIRKYDSQRPYWPSSPSIGWGHAESLNKGDAHYWGVWWGEEPFTAYTEKVGRFMSEYGFQGFPDKRTMEAFSLPEDLQLGSGVIKAHQKHPRGMQLIRLYMDRDYQVPANFNDYLYTSQLNQAEGITLAIEAHRRAKPYCMGTLYWQLNDCWPVISWSGMDYYHRWKPLHYHIAHAYEKILVSPYLEDGNLKVAIINDGLLASSGTLESSLISFQGDTLKHIEAEVTLPTNSGRVFFEADTAAYLKGFSSDEIFFTARFIHDNETMAENCLYFLPVKHLQLEGPPPAVKVSPVQNGWKISLTCAYLVKNLWLTAPGDEGHFSDNSFDLFPGKEKTVLFTPADTAFNLRDNLLLTSLNDIVSRIK